GQQRPSAREEPVTFADPSPQARWAKRDAWSLNIFFPFRGARQRSYRRFGGRNAAAPEERLAYVFNSMVGTARCAVPARVVAGGTNNRPALAFEGVAPLHAARTSQRDVPTTLNTYWLPAALGRRDACPTVSAAPSVLLRLRYFIVTVACGLPLLLTAGGGGEALWVTNRPPLPPSAFMKLPIGSIKPKGWLRRQLELEANGMTGHLEEISKWCKFENSAWASPDGQGQFGWEELPYWLKGYGDLGYVLGDERIIKEARRWIEGVLSSQEESGWFGPRSLKTSLQGKPDLWPHMVMLNVLQSHYEYSHDERV